MQIEALLKEMGKCKLNDPSEEKNKLYQSINTINTFLDELEKFEGVL